MAATVRLAGSAGARTQSSAVVTRRPLSSAELAAPAAVTLHLRESPEHDTLGVALARQQHTPIQGRGYLSAPELAAAHRASPEDVTAVTRWATEAGLRVRRRSDTGTALDLIAPLGCLARAFHVGLDGCRARDLRTGALTVFREHRDELAVPAALEGVVTAALGLSDHPVARPRLGMLPRGTAAAHSYAPAEIARIYDFPVLPEGGRGTTITVGIAELGGAVYRPDLKALGALNPRARVIEEVVQGWGPVSDPFGPDTEVALDWQVIAGVLGYCAPLAEVVVVIKYAHNTERGFTNLEASFATDGRDYAAVSTSWGAPEDLWTAAAMDAMDRAFQMGALRGIAHTVAAGDNGSTDARSDGRQHADHPASAPHAVGCGGTRLVAEGGRRISEEAWNELGVGEGAGGGGVSDHFAVPRYQASAGINPVSADRGGSGRGVPDVAGNADPLTGYVIHHRGTDTVVGGTSAVAPLWAALLCAVSAGAGHRLGNVLPALYGARSVGFTDVVSGDNGAYRSGAGWDAVTGLGAPSGRALCAAVKSSLVLGPPTRAVVSRRGPDRELG